MRELESELTGKLQAEIDHWPSLGLPSVIAAVQCPALNLDWQGAAGVEQGQRQIAQRSFRIASVSKMYVAAAILRLMEDGKLSLQHSIASYLSETSVAQLASGNYSARQIQIHHLLSHTSGLRDHAEESYKAAVLAQPHKRWTRADQLAWCLQLGAPLSEPGECFGYSDTAYVLLGEIIELLCEQALGPAVRALLGFDELGLSQTWWEEQEPVPPQAWPRCSQLIGEVNGRDFEPSFDLFGGGGLISSAADLARFARAMLRGEIFKQPTTLASGLLVPSTERPPDAHTHSRLAMALRMGEGWGWGHLGFWGCAAVYNAEQDVSVGLTVNQSDRNDPLMLTRCLRRLSGIAMDARA